MNGFAPFRDSSETTENSLVVELRGITKSFGGVRALHPVDLTLHAGEIVGLVGENGAGKSTLIKLLSGVHAPDAGSICIDGQEVKLRSPRDALRLGIATIHQELEGFPHLSVAENMLLGRVWPRRFWGGVNWLALVAEAQQLLEDFGLKIDPTRTLAELTSAEKQEVAIATALSRQARVVVLDEPTASLTQPEVKRLFERLRRATREPGRQVAVLYVSHRLDEIFGLTDRVVVLRDGVRVAVHATKEIDPPRLVHDMIGRPLEQVYPHAPGRPVGAPLLELQRVGRRGMFERVSFSLHAGEIVGVAGLVGAGRSELARAIYGLYPIETGSIRLKGTPWRATHPRQAIRSGLVYLPEERKRQGIVGIHSLADTIAIGFADQLSRWGMIRTAAERERIERAIDRYDIRPADRRRSVSLFSGGNQQKAVLARWLERDPDIVILDEPTRGVDVAAKSQIHSLIDELAGRGKGILLISSDFSEVLGMSDRVLVMNRGRIETELRGGEMTTHNLLLAASGLYPRSFAPKTNPVTS